MRISRVPATHEAALEVGHFLWGTFAHEVDFAGIKTDQINPERAFQYIWEAVSEGGAWVAHDEDGIAGTISVMPRVLWWADTDYWGDGWFYIRPEKRRSRAALMLLRAAEAFAREKKEPLVISVWNAADVERKDALFRHLGYAHLGGYYVKEV